MTLSTKVNASRFFEDFTLNEVILHATPRTITTGDAALYIALTGERNPLHCSEPFAQSLGYKTTPIDNLLAFHIAFGKTVPDISVNAIANLGYAEVKFIQPVFVGDTLTTSSEVIGLKQNSNGKSGVVWVRSTTVNQNKFLVMSWVRWAMVHKSNLSTPAPEMVVPVLAPFVSVDQLKLSPYMSAKYYNTGATGGAYLWEDYQIGERINHAAGMTINESDHSLATRLYQNNAKLHFDAQLMKSSPIGHRLVYGGVIISTCRALSFEGLENALSILAINGGTHANPSFAGDTIYTMTEVLEAWPLPKRTDIGALRLRMVGIKNMPANELTDIKTDQGYHPNVVLDLDYTVHMPRKH
ncbi:MAG: MaoC family dehydratase [Methylophilaceae bacterium]